MPNTYFDSELTGEQIEAALNAIHGVVTPQNNGKVLAIEDGEIVAKSASEWMDTPVLEPLSVTENGDYIPEEGVDGYNAVHVAVPGATLTTKSITQNGTYSASQDDADGYSAVTVNVPGGAVVQPLSVTQNGTYNPPSGVNGYAPVTVNVSGSGGDDFYAVPTLPNEYQLVEYIDFAGEQWFEIPATISTTPRPTIYTKSCMLQAPLEGSESTLIGNASPGIDIFYNSARTFDFTYGAPRGNYVYEAHYMDNGVSNTIYSSETIPTMDTVVESITEYTGKNADFLWVGQYRLSGSRYRFSGRLYRVCFASLEDPQLIGKTMTKIIDLWPCYRKADNVIGFYDVVGDVFYINQGEGSFIKGPDAN